MTLISAPAGFGKTTLISEWVEKNNQPVAWLSLEEEDSSLTRFLTYLVTAMQTILPDMGKDVFLDLNHPNHHQRINPDFAAQRNRCILGDFYLVLDDYHVIDAKPVDEIIAFLLEHMPPQMHLVISTREDPNLPLARLRARGQND